MESNAPARKSFLDHAGSVAGSIIRHVPTRGALWGFIGFVVGAVCLTLSYVLGPRIFGSSVGRDTTVGGVLVYLALLLPILGAAFFTVHGLHRGAARAILDLERKSGLVAWAVDRVLALLTDKLGGPISNLPLQQLEAKLKEVLDRWIKTSEGEGVGAWVVNRAKRALTDKIESTLLSAYRAEQTADGKGGGVSMDKVRARVQSELSEGLADLVMGPLNQQLAIFMTAYVLLAAGWWYWMSLLVTVLSALRH